MSVVPADSVALRARACRIASSVDAPTAVTEFVRAAVHPWQLPAWVVEQCGEAAGVLATAMLRRSTTAVHVEVWLHLDAVWLRVRDELGAASADDDRPTGPPVDDDGVLSIDFGSGTAIVRLGRTPASEGADVEPHLTSESSGTRHARARRRLPLSSRFARADGSTTTVTKGSDADSPDRGPRDGVGGRDGVPAPRRG